MSLTCECEAGGPSFSAWFHFQTSPGINWASPNTASQLFLKFSSKFKPPSRVLMHQLSFNCSHLKRLKSGSWVYAFRQQFSMNQHPWGTRDWLIKGEIAANWHASVAHSSLLHIYFFVEMYLSLKRDLDVNETTWMKIKQKPAHPRGINYKPHI